MKTFFAILIILAVVGSLFAIFVRFILLAKTPEQTIKRAKTVSVITLISVVVGAYFSIHYLQQSREQLDAHYQALSAKSQAHAYAVAEFRKCLETPIKKFASPSKSKTSDCRIYTYKQINNSPYKDNWPQIKQDLTHFIATYLK